MPRALLDKHDADHSPPTEYFKANKFTCIGPQGDSTNRAYK